MPIPKNTWLSVSRKYGSYTYTKSTEMALKNNLLPVRYTLIHHSDRGTQYCCDEYIKILKKHHIQISMTENGDPLENAIAERLNGIIKEEYLDCYQYKSIKELYCKLDQAVNYYNLERPHLSCSMKTPELVHKSNLITIKKWKNYYKPKTENQTM
jgi:transposase InsO family protein